MGFRHERCAGFFSLFGITYMCWLVFLYKICVCFCLVYEKCAGVRLVGLVAM